MSRFLSRLMRPGRDPGGVPDDADEGPALDDAEPDAVAPAGEPRAPAPERPGAPAGQPAPPAPELSPQARRALGQLKALGAADLAALATVDGPVKTAVEQELTRRGMVAQAQAAAQGRATRAQDYDRLEAQERALRATDVYEAARVRDQLDAMRQQDGFLTHMVQAYDRVSLDPLLLALPEAERKPLLEAMPPGMDGRKYVTEAAVKRIKALAEQAAARKLAKDPAFRKQVLAQWRGDPAEADDEPELGADRRAVGARPGGGRSAMDALIRRGFGQRVG